MRTIKLTIQYDGTDYCGWQEQPNGISVQETVETALSRILGNRVRVQASGRTDSGVHALAMPAAFRTESTIPTRAFVEGLNGLLPPDIAVTAAIEVEGGFRPIGDAVAKHYRYTIYLGRTRAPLSRRTSWHIRQPLDLGLMKKGAAQFAGTYDFGSFRAANCTAVTTVRRIEAVTLTQTGCCLYIDVLGEGFLKNMVRIMVGTLVDIGRKRLSENAVAELLQTPERKKAGVTAPACGLCLVRVWYPGDGLPAIFPPEAF